MKIIAVVVTYNRKELLKECLDALYMQTYRIDEVVLIDNASTDGTDGYVKEYMNIQKNLIYRRLKKNIGGAGGFYEGIKLAFHRDADWIWVMDDDTIPCSNSLYELLEAIKVVGEKTSFLASSVYGMNNKPMNVPVIDKDSNNGNYPDWYIYLENGMVKIKIATFVSLLINSKAVEHCGLPCRDFFIWGDDSEYTQRLTKFFAPAYLTGKSKVIHKRKDTGKISIVRESDKKRIKMQYFSIRNSLINARAYKGIKGIFVLTAKYLIWMCQIVFHKNQFKLLKLKIILKGYFAYFFKRYDKRAFDNRMDFDGQEKSYC